MMCKPAASNLAGVIIKTRLFLAPVLSGFLSISAHAAPVVYSEFSPVASGLSGGAEAAFIADSGTLDFESFEALPLSPYYASPAAITQITTDGFTVSGLVIMLLAMTLFLILRYSFSGLLIVICIVQPR